MNFTDNSSSKIIAEMQTEIDNLKLSIKNKFKLYDRILVSGTETKTATIPGVYNYDGWTVIIPKGGFRVGLGTPVVYISIDVDLTDYNKNRDWYVKLFNGQGDHVMDNPLRPGGVSEYCNTFTALNFQNQDWGVAIKTSTLPVRNVTILCKNSVDFTCSDDFP